MNMNELLEMAYKYGMDAIKSNRPSAPIHDPNLMNMVKENREGKEFGWTTKVFDAWSKGYHYNILGH